MLYLRFANKPLGKWDGNIPHRSESQCTGQTGNWTVGCRLANLLAVEKWLQIVGEAFKSKRVPTGADS